MIKIINCNNRNYLKKIHYFLNKRRSDKYIDKGIVSKIIKDIKRNKKKALLKYEKRFSKNSKIKVNSSQIKHSHLYLNIDANDLVDIILYLKTSKDTMFKQLIDITAIDYPQNEKRFKK